MYFESPDIFAFMVDPPKTTPKAKNRGFNKGPLLYKNC